MLSSTFIDELGYVPFSKAGAELLFEVISRAYEHHSLMVTTNLAFEEWTEIFGSERLTGPLLDRLTHRVFQVTSQVPIDFGKGRGVKSAFKANISSRKGMVVPKDKVKELLGRSPDYSDMLMMRCWFEYRVLNNFFTF